MALYFFKQAGKYGQNFAKIYPPLSVCLQTMKHCVCSTPLSHCRGEGGVVCVWSFMNMFEALFPACGHTMSIAYPIIENNSTMHAGIWKNMKEVLEAWREAKCFWHFSSVLLNFVCIKSPQSTLTSALILLQNEENTCMSDNFFARQKRWPLFMHLFCLSNEKKHWEREICWYS